MKVIVSLTSIVGNLRTLQPTLTSLLCQTRPPDELRLYLSEERYLKDIGFAGKIVPPWLTELPIRIIWTENTGPYRKLLPVLQECWNDDTVIITVDDDTCYEEHFVENMVKAYTAWDCVVACRSVFVDNPVTTEYSTHQKAKLHDVYNFHTGKGGVLYHPKFFHASGILESREYLRLCPTGDDMWFNLWRMYKKVPCLYLGDVYNYMIFDLTNSATALWHNFNSVANSKMFRDTATFIFQPTK
jgi:hypothetical protein